ncbi:hypothetical protein PG985_008091 [Apiospora marii]|uniref:Uncharacterized protein n=1 Tax=Apiospora marii TaxID=335849 RepID=A0ABR1R9M1_9PEZI
MFSSTSSSGEDATPDVNAQDGLGRTALHWAAAMDRTEWAEYIMKQPGADVVRKETDGKTPLHEAVISGHKHMVELLLQDQRIRDNIDTRDNMGRTAMHWAADHGREKMVPLLTARGANLLAADMSSHTALHRAVRSQCKDVMGQLVSSLTDDEKKKAMASAIEQEHLDVAGAMYSKDWGTIIGGLGSASWERLLCVAAERGDEAVVELLLQKDTGLLCWPMDAQFALRGATARGHATVVQELLLVENVNVNGYEQGIRWPRPILQAVDKGHTSVVEVLLRHGDIDLELTDISGYTPLLMAAKRGYTAILQLLLEKGASVAATVERGRSAVSFAAQNGHCDAMRLLIQNKAEVDSCDDGGRTPLSYAAEKGREDAVRLLIDEGARIDSEGKPTNLKLGAYRGKHAYSQTPLEYASAHGHGRVVKLLSTYEHLVRDIP